MNEHEFHSLSQSLRPGEDNRLIPPRRFSSKLKAVMHHNECGRTIPVFPMNLPVT